MGTDIEPVPVTGLAANFSPMPRMAPPPLGRLIDGATVRNDGASSRPAATRERDSGERPCGESMAGLLLRDAASSTASRSVHSPAPRRVGAAGLRTPSQCFAPVVRASQAESEYRTTRKTWRTARLQHGRVRRGHEWRWGRRALELIGDHHRYGRRRWSVCGELRTLSSLQAAEIDRLGPPSVVGDDDIHLL